jgi:hypothetical protein
MLFCTYGCEDNFRFFLVSPFDEGMSGYEVLWKFHILILFQHVFVTYQMFVGGLNFDVWVSVGVGVEFCYLRFLQFSRVPVIVASYY